MSRDDDEIAAAYREAVFNGRGIDWRHWVHQMSKLTTGEAARLIVGLDPDVFVTLNERPNKNDPSRQCSNAKKIERLASREGRIEDTPEGWLRWAKNNALAIHIGFALAVRDKPTFVQFASLPVDQRKLWDEAKQVTDDCRDVETVFADSHQTERLTLETFCERVADRLHRWSIGEYKVVEAAQILANQNPGLDAVTLRKQMESAIHEGRLLFRKNGIPLVGDDIPRGALFFKTVRLDDVNNWLRHVGAQYQLAYPYSIAATKAQPETPAPVATGKAAQVEDKPWLVPDHKDPKAAQPWYTPARYFARQLVLKDSTLLTKKPILAEKVARSLFNVGICKRGGEKRLAPETVLKAFANVKLG